MTRRGRFADSPSLTPTERTSSDPPDGKRRRPSAPATSSSHRDPHKLDLKFPSAWTPADDLVLVRAVEESFKSGSEREGDGIDWPGVVEALPGKRRTRRQVEGRWNALVQQGAPALSLFARSLRSSLS